MLKTKLSLLFLFLFLPLSVGAAQFVANINKDSLAVGEMLVLELRLSDTSPTGDPDLAGLPKDFALLSKQQLANTVIVNGKTSLSFSWQYLLSPLREGKLAIPSFSIESAAGTLQTKPMTVVVDQGGGGPRPSVPQRPVSPPKSGADSQKTILSSTVSKTTPYKNEPLIYTLRLVTKENLGNVQLQSLSMKGAIVKPLGKPEIYEEREGEDLKMIIEAKYSIIPLQTGSLVIPKCTLKGERLVREKESLDTLLGGAMDPFGILQKFSSMGGFGFDKVEPFSLSSQEITLKVQAPSPLVSPWIPATSLKISEDLKGGEAAKVGEPLTRTFTLVGEGVAAAQLPSLKDKQGLEGLVKIYEEKPTVEENFKKNTLHSWREETYTLIPQRPGKLVLPAISVAWWNVKANKVEQALIPERVLEIAPGITQPSPQPPAEASTDETAAEDKKAAFSEGGLAELGERRRIPLLLYGLGALLIVVILGMGAWAFRLKRKLSRLGEEKERKEPSFQGLQPQAPASSAALPEQISQAKTVREVFLLLQGYAASHWGTSPHASVEVLFAAARIHVPSLSSEESTEAIKQLNDALYAGKERDLDKVKALCLRLIRETEGKKKKEPGKRQKTLPDLNPT